MLKRIIGLSVAIAMVLAFSFFPEAQAKSNKENGLKKLQAFGIVSYDDIFVIAT